MPALRIRRFLLTAFVAALAAFVVLVQRDTFVRRWLVPAPKGRAKLEQVLPQVEIAGVTLPQAAADLSRMAAVDIDVQPHVDLEPGIEAPKYSLRLKNVTLGRALELLAEQGATAGKVPRVILQGDRIHIVSEDAADAAVVLRAYDIADLLPPPGQMTMSAMPQAAQTSVPSTDRELAVDAILDLVERLVPDLPYIAAPTMSGRQAGTLFSNSPTGPLLMLNNRLIVLAPETAQARVAELLAGLRSSGGLFRRP
jgi:hypothetical protein